MSSFPRTKFGGYFRKRTPRQIYANGEGTQFQDPATLAKAIKRSKYLFPGIVQNETEFYEEDFFDTRQLQYFLLMRVNERYNGLSEEEMQWLMQRENAVELCVKLGMSELYATVRFTAVEAMLNELGASRKLPVIACVCGLIDTMELDKSFSDQVDEATCEATPWLTYQAVGFKKGKLDQALQDASDFLESTRIKNGDSEPYYMHGTVSGVLKKVLDDNGNISISDEHDKKRGPDDLGSGL
ncbi:MAG: hypothetical protein SGARI_006055, partial [Bacillariaceae sp.]